MDHVAVVGASLAGARAAEALRRLGHEGRITLVGEERAAPYDRPPLSKEVLAGEWDAERAVLPIDGLTADAGVEFRLGCRATSLDLQRRVIATSDDAGPVAFDGLVIATGARPRLLPGAAALEGVHVLRTMEDCLAIRDAFARRARVAVIGAGFIGSEVAATARGRGLEVTVLEALSLPLVRVLGPVIGEVCASLHRDHGVDLRLGAGVAAFEGEGRVERIRLVDGTTIEADVVIVGVGVVPNTEWLDGSGLTLDNGVVCDETCAAVGARDVVAAGDVARWPNPLFGASMRIEHWTNAVEQAEAAAARLMAGQRGEEPQPFAPVPFFWSDQYDRKIQYVGSSAPDDEFVVVDGSLPERRFAAAYGRGGRTVAAIAFNRPRPLMALRRMIADRAPFPPTLP